MDIERICIMKNKKKLIISGIIFVIFIFVFISIFFYANNYDKLKSRAHEKYLSNNFGIVAASMIDKEDFIIYGNLFNKTNKEYSNVKLIFSVYNEENEKLDTCYETFINFREDKSFQIICGNILEVDYYLLDDLVYQ